MSECSMFYFKLHSEHMYRIIIVNIALWKLNEITIMYKYIRVTNYFYVHIENNNIIT